MKKTTTFFFALLAFPLVIPYSASAKTTPKLDGRLDIQTDTTPLKQGQVFSVYATYVPNPSSTVRTLDAIDVYSDGKLEKTCVQTNDCYAMFINPSDRTVGYAFYAQGRTAAGIARYSTTTVRNVVGGTLPVIQPLPDSDAEEELEPPPLSIVSATGTDASTFRGLAERFDLRFSRRPAKASLAVTDLWTRKKRTFNLKFGGSRTDGASIATSTLLVDKLSSDKDYRFVLRAEDEKGNVTTTQGVFKTPNLSGTYVAMDYEIVGTNRRGSILLRPKGPDASKLGYEFATGTYTGQTGGAFYTKLDKGRTVIYANKPGQGGIARLANGKTPPPPVTSKRYNRLGEFMEPNAWIAAYDAKNKQVIKLHVTDIMTLK